MLLFLLLFAMLLLLFAVFTVVAVVVAVVCCIVDVVAVVAVVGVVAIPVVVFVCCLKESITLLGGMILAGLSLASSLVVNWYRLGSGTAANCKLVLSIGLAKHRHRSELKK
ncbi:unnamed protein product [Polarella glacialis]|uniref:Uncharacterized protein n=1 Tax=Polarella glacialis TaxID=89957 RepID=A0A813LI77_POLGL|nr:unnamed protein product [Polarella glacialis]